MEKLISKGKHTVKVGTHPYTKLVGKLKDKIVKLSISKVSS